MLNIYSPQIQMAAHTTTFVTTCPFFLEEKRTKPNKISSYQVSCNDHIYFASCSIHFPASTVHTVANNKRDSGMRA